MKNYRVVNPPDEHRMEGELRVCDPAKTDHTKDMESWRLFKIMAEFVEGFELLRKYNLSATFFGSARTTEDEPIYQEARQLGAKLAGSGFAVITGGAAGGMEGGKRGGHQTRKKNIYLKI